ncbi:MAG: hypothetical protein IT300_04510 [Dehalococcoidia bacterium]|nr:hypothetical protein [Dehalococcoidia bacterium]
MNGVGDLLLDGKHAARVHYRIRQDQEFLITDALTGESTETPGLRSTAGTLTPIEGRIELKQYVLRMEDGRELDVLVNRMTFPGRPVLVLGSGEIRTSGNT